MMSDTICPLSISSPDDPDNLPLVPCRRGECAWWDEDAQKCAVLVIARAVKRGRQ